MFGRALSPSAVVLRPDVASAARPTAVTTSRSVVHCAVRLDVDLEASSPCSSIFARRATPRSSVARANVSRSYAEHELAVFDRPWSTSPSSSARP